MKKYLLLACALALLTTTGCLVADGGPYRHHGHHGGYHGRSDVIVRRPVVIAPAPVIVVPVPVVPVPRVRVHVD